MPGMDRDTVKFSLQREFMRHFEKDVEFFRMVFLLINQSRSIK